MPVAWDKMWDLYLVEKAECSKWTAKTSMHLSLNLQKKLDRRTTGYRSAACTVQYTDSPFSNRIWNLQTRHAISVTIDVRCEVDGVSQLTWRAWRRRVGVEDTRELGLVSWNASSRRPYTRLSRISTLHVSCIEILGMSSDRLYRSETR